MAKFFSMGEGFRCVHLGALVFAVAIRVDGAAGAGESPGYNKDVRTILSSKCFTCHGPDEAKRKPSREPLRLDIRESALGVRKDGAAAIVPGDLGKSELVARITSGDPDEQMPPSDFHPKLTDAEREILKRWIADEAEYEAHWAFERPEAGDLPAVANAGWVRNGVDTFVGARLDREGWKPAGEASKETLVRRVMLSLTGLPPTPQEVDAFVKDGSPDAYEKMVDRVLASDFYGERMAWFWLDAARYADTDGYQGDKGRTMWPWRDWVIKAFNGNMGFDRFTVEQLAGDLLPEAGDQELLASAFNRNHRLNNEGGALPEEFIVEYAIDRAETTSAVWLGLTMGCARCHDHKYDPISQKEFFQFYGYFNNIGENGKAGGLNAPPMISVASPLAGDAAGKEAEAGLAAAEAALEALLAKADGAAEWERGVLAEVESERAMWSPPGDTVAVAKAGGTLVKKGEDGSFLYTGTNAANEVYEVTVTPPPGMERVTGLRLEVMGDATLTNPVGYARSVNGNFVLTAFEVGLLEPGTDGAKPVGIGKAEATYEQPSYGVAGAVNPAAGDGWALGANPQAGRSPIFASFVLKEPIAVGEGVQITVRMRHESRFAQHNVGRFRIQLSDAAAPVAAGESGVDPKLVAALETAAGDRSEDEKGLVRAYRVANDPGLKVAGSEILKWEEKVKASRGPAVNVMVMRERPEVMPTYLLERGQYDAPDKSEVLARRLPAALTGKAGAVEGAPKDRLEMARWLVSEENPLTARVTVNRIWQQHFGIGLVKTSEDFGAQGELPSHPALLDWLAVEFMKSGWDVKALHRLILTSATYRQSSVVPAEMGERDPENRLLARGPRFRLDGAAIRDQALYLGGLMNDRMGGAPVKPYQPPGLWQTVAGSSNERYGRGKGADLYRRTLYTYWKRAVAPPRLLIFDASGREACNVRNRVTNTPLQALVLMNDETFVEAARAMGERMIKEGGETVEGRIKFGFQMATGRTADGGRLEILKGNYAFYLDHFTEAAAAGEAFLSVGDSARDKTIPAAEAAAFAAVAHLLLNLDETITLE